MWDQTGFGYVGFDNYCVCSIYIRAGSYQIQRNVWTCRWKYWRCKGNIICSCRTKRQKYYEPVPNTLIKS